MDIFNTDLCNIIKETILDNQLEDKNFQQLLDLDIIEYIYLIISQIHNIKYEDAEEIISFHLRNSIKENNKNNLCNNLLDDLTKIDLNSFKNEVINVENKFSRIKNKIEKEINEEQEINEDNLNKITLIKQNSEELADIININIETNIEINSQNTLNQEINSLIKSDYKEVEISDLSINHINLSKKDEIAKLSTQKQYILDNQKYTNLNINIMIDKLNKLRSIILPEQRSKEWYEYRHNMITASDLYKVLGTEGIKRDLIIKKCSSIDPNKKVGGGDACRHGIKYEPLATKIYELRHKVTILEFGCIPHQDSTIPFGASPDGICSEDNHFYAGRMLEIKCPYTRVITGKIPEMYWKQVQGQLEVCDLEVCDFLECKFEEYSNEDEFYQDGDEYKTSLGNEKGIIIVFSNKENITEYSYSQIGLSKDENNQWIEQETNKILQNDNLNFIGITYWKLTIFSCVLIYRDRNWFQEIFPLIIDFWTKIEYYRNNGIEDLIAKKKKRVKKVLNLDDKCLID